MFNIQVGVFVMLAALISMIARKYNATEAMHHVAGPDS